jgi:hypothetical protein
MDTDAEFNAAIRRHTGIALDHSVLHFDGTTYGVDHTAEFNESPVAGALYHAPVMDGDRRIDEIAS